MVPRTNSDFVVTLQELAPDWTTRIRFLIAAGDIFPDWSVRIGSPDHPASDLWVPGIRVPEAKWPRV